MLRQGNAPVRFISPRCLIRRKQANERFETTKSEDRMIFGRILRSLVSDIPGEARALDFAAFKAVAIRTGGWACRLLHLRQRHLFTRGGRLRLRFMAGPAAL